MYVYICNLLNWLIGYNSANPTIADNEKKVQGSSNCSVCEVGYLIWFSVYSGIMKYVLLPAKKMVF